MEGNTSQSAPTDVGATVAYRAGTLGEQPVPIPSTGRTLLRIFLLLVGIPIALSAVIGLGAKLFGIKLDGPAATTAVKSTPAPVIRTPEEQELLDITTRDTLAQVMEDRLLSQDMNVDVNAIGPKHTVLRLKWFGVSKVTAYHFTHEGQDLFRGLQKAGFTQFVITDGFDETWSWDLEPLAEGGPQSSR